MKLVEYLIEAISGRRNSSRYTEPEDLRVDMNYKEFLECVDNFKYGSENLGKADTWGQITDIFEPVKRETGLYYCTGHFGFGGQSTKAVTIFNQITDTAYIFQFRDDFGSEKMTRIVWLTCYSKGSYNCLRETTGSRLKNGLEDSIEGIRLVIDKK